MPDLGKTHYDTAHVGLTASRPVRMVATKRRQALARHDHDFFEIMLVTDGTGHHELDSGVLPVQAGQVLVLRPGSYHGLSEGSEVAFVYCWFLPSLLDGPSFRWLGEEPQISRLLHPSGLQAGPGQPVVLQLDQSRISRCLALIEPVAEDLTEAQGRETPTGESAAVLIGRLVALLGDLAGARGRQTDRPVPGIVRRALKAMENDLKRPWRLEDLAEVADISPAYLNRRFSAAMGIPPIAYLSRLRVERAAMLLRRTDNPVVTIGQRVGYERADHFNRRFKELFGISPGAYRRRHREAAAADGVANG